MARVYSAPALYGVGDRGRATRETDKKERTLSADLPAYKRFRHAGMQPHGIDGCDRLEATAATEMEVNSKGVISGNEHQVREAMEYARDIGAGRA